MCYWHHIGALDGFSSFYLVSKFDWNSISVLYYVKEDT